jgi:shikimate dehydrogenase
VVRIAEGTTGVIVKGTTRLYAIVGDPIAQVRSPETFTARFAESNHDAILVPAWIPAARFEGTLSGLMGLENLDGVLFTVPFKVRATRFATRLGDAARAVGALNALRREADGSWTGDMFDGVGFIRGAENKGARVRGRRVALFGAGGAGSAIAHALGVAGVQSIDIVDPMNDRAATLASRLQPLLPDCRFATAERVPGDADMIVNASPVGMRDGDGMPADLGTLPRETLVGDVVIADAPTPLVRHAMACGCEWVDGRAMLAGQVDAIMAFLGPRLRANASAARSPEPSTAHGSHPR